MLRGYLKYEVFPYSTFLISLVMFLWQLIAFLVVVYLCDEVLLSIASPSLLPSLPCFLCKANFTQSDKHRGGSGKMSAAQTTVRPPAADAMHHFLSQPY